MLIRSYYAEKINDTLWNLRYEITDDSLDLWKDFEPRKKEIEEKIIKFVESYNTLLLPGYKFEATNIQFTRGSISVTLTIAIIVPQYAVGIFAVALLVGVIGIIAIVMNENIRKDIKDIIIAFFRGGKF
jgi:hypothetical protein